MTTTRTAMRTTAVAALAASAALVARGARIFDSRTQAVDARELVASGPAVVVSTPPTVGRQWTHGAVYNATTLLVVDAHLAPSATSPDPSVDDAANAATADDLAGELASALSGSWASQWLGEKPDPSTIRLVAEAVRDEERRALVHARLEILVAHRLQWEPDLSAAPIGHAAVTANVDGDTNARPAVSWVSPDEEV